MVVLLAGGASSIISASCRKLLWTMGCDGWFNDWRRFTAFRFETYIRYTDLWSQEFTDFDKIYLAFVISLVSLI